MLKYEVTMFSLAKYCLQTPFDEQRTLSPSIQWKEGGSKDFRSQYSPLIFKGLTFSNLFRALPKFRFDLPKRHQRRERLKHAISLDISLAVDRVDIATSEHGYGASCIRSTDAVVLSYREHCSDMSDSRLAPWQTSKLSTFGKRRRAEHTLHYIQ